MKTAFNAHDQKSMFFCAHVSVNLVVPRCSELKNAINGRSLTELGELEQNLVYGDAGSQELIKFLQGEVLDVVWACVWG